MWNAATAAVRPGLVVVSSSLVATASSRLPQPEAGVSSVPDSGGLRVAREAMTMDHRFLPDSSGETNKAVPDSQPDDLERQGKLFHRVDWLLNLFGGCPCCPQVGHRIIGTGSWLFTGSLLEFVARINATGPNVARQWPAKHDGRRLRSSDVLHLHEIGRRLGRQRLHAPEARIRIIPANVISSTLPGCRDAIGCGWFVRGL